MDEYLRANRELWNARAKIHEKSQFYDLKGFIRGDQTLDPIEIQEVGDVSGKSLLHLMCHFGLDTLSWARLGARVTGVDFSEEAITMARKISEEVGVPAMFVCTNIYDLNETLEEEFDIVFTSGGVINWLPDLKEWARILAQHVKPGGTFYIREFHPFSYIFDDETEGEHLRVRYPYFHSVEPLRFESTDSYACPGVELPRKEQFEWIHSVSDIINALINAGLAIEYFNEFPFTTWQAIPFMMKHEDGRWRLPSNQDSVPFMFSLKARKPMD